MANNEAKQKAKELIEYFDELLTYRESKQKVKQCAIKVCDEIQKSMDEVMPHPPFQEFYKQVKKEIENYEQ